MQVLTFITDAVAHKVAGSERGAVGWLAIGVILGALLVIGVIIKLLIPGD